MSFTSAQDSPSPKRITMKIKNLLLATMLASAVAFAADAAKPAAAAPAAGPRPARPAAGDVTVNKPLFAQKSAAAFEPGDRVSHMTFGVGEILSVKQMGTDTLYEIVFEKVGTKKLMATYARLKKVDR